MKTEAKIILASAIVIILFGMLSSELIKTRSAALSAAAVGTEQGSFVCTMDAKVCPDGSFVGRVPPYCHFAECSTAFVNPLSDID